jgi:hypothetical protein
MFTGTSCSRSRNLWKLAPEPKPMLTIMLTFVIFYLYNDKIFLIGQ